MPVGLGAEKQIDWEKQEKLIYGFFQFFLAVEWMWE